MTNNIHLIQPASLNAKRQALNLLAQHADAMTVTEVVKLLADPAPDVALDEAPRPLVQYADEELGAEEIRRSQRNSSWRRQFAEDHIVELRGALELLARHATAKQLHAAMLDCVQPPND